MNSNLGSQLSKACESVVLVMDVVGHVLQILTSISIVLVKYYLKVNTKVSKQL